MTGHVYFIVNDQANTYRKKERGEICREWHGKCGCDISTQNLRTTFTVLHQCTSIFFVPTARPAHLLDVLRN